MKPTGMHGLAAAIALAVLLPHLIPGPALAGAPGGSRPAMHTARPTDPGGLLFSTFSICAIDAKTGESGAAVTTRVPFVGRAVPWVRAGVGAVATQAWTVVEYGRQGLDLMEKDVSPEQAIERLLAGDKGREKRQIALIDMQGRTAAFTGKETNAWAGSRQGPGYTVQGNILVGREVVDAVADHFEATAGTGMKLAERLILALEAGQKAGGDKRRGRFQSAAIRIADPGDPGRGGDHISLAIDVGEHPEPVTEMKRIYQTTSRRLGYRTFSIVEGPDVVELKRMLQTAGYWRKGAAAIPDAPRLPDLDPSWLRTDPSRLDALFNEQDARQKEYMQAWGVFDAEAVEAVDAFRKAHGLDYEGNPRGLVDAALVEALRKLHFTRR